MTSSLHTSGAPVQSFCSPKAAPFLEIRTTLESRLPYAAHFHEDFCIGVILQGRTCITLNGKPREARTGDVVLIPAGQVHSCNPFAGETRSYHMLFFDNRWFSSRLAEYGICSPPSVTSIVTDPAMFEECTALVQAAMNGELPAIPFERLFKLLCASFQEGPDTRNDITAALKKHRKKRELSMPGEHSLTVSGLAQTFGMRRESFSRAIRRATGLPPSLYMHCLRMEHGRRLLRTGVSVAEAAVTTGYADQSHFHRMFVRFYSVTPGCYRKNRSHLYKK